MNRTEKIQSVEAMTEAFRRSPNVVVTGNTGLSAAQSTELRRRIRASGGRFRVVQNRLAKRASEGTAVGLVRDKLVGPCGIAMHDSDPVALAKVLTEFAKDNPQLRLVAGVVDGRDVVVGEGLKQLAALPGLQELRAQLLALIQTPATMMVRLIGTPASQIARAVDARREKLEGGAE